MSLLRKVEVKAQDSPSVDAFSRWRTSDPVGLFDSQFQYNLNALLWEAVVSGAGNTVAHSPANSGALLTSSTGATDYTVLQTYQYHRYQPGRSQLVAMTFCLQTAPVANCTQRVGLFDANNGIFLQRTSAGVSLVRRTDVGGSVSDSDAVAQASWNLDPMNGSGPSGITLNFTKTQILWIDAQWLGVGRVRVGFDVDGKLYYVHEFKHANSLAVPYTRTLNLPLRYELRNSDTTSGANTLLAICCTIMSEGGFEVERGYPFAIGNGTASISANTRRAVLSIRPAATLNSITTRGLIMPEELEVVTSGGSVYWELVYNPTYTTGGGALTWTGVDTTNSMVEYSVHGDANAGAFTGGVVIKAGYCVAPATGISSRASTSDIITSRLPITLDSAGANPRALALVCTGIGGAVTTYGALGWREIR